MDELLVRNVLSTLSSREKRSLLLKKLLLSTATTFLMVCFTLGVLLSGRMDVRREQGRHMARYLQTVVEERFQLVGEGFLYWSEMVRAVRKRDRQFLIEQCDRLRHLAGVVEIVFRDREEEVFRVGSTAPLGPLTRGRVPRRGGLLEAGRAIVLYDDQGKPQPELVVSVWLDLTDTVRRLEKFSRLPRPVSVPVAGGVEILPGAWFPALSRKAVLKELFAEPDVRLALGLQSALVFVLSLLAVSLVRERSSRRERLVSLAGILEEKDTYTMGHSSRVAGYAVAIALEMRFSRRELNLLHLGALCHDLGKIFVPLDILNKPGALSPAEWAAMKKHPVDSERLFLKLLHQPELGTIIRHHHERWDGQGYPDGLAGEAIPLHSRIIAVADTFDALTSCRSYREALPLETALRVLKEGAGTQLDPRVVEAAIPRLPEAYASRTEIRGLAPIFGGESS